MKMQTPKIDTKLILEAIGELKVDVGTLKTDVGTLKAGMNDLKNDTELILHAVNDFSTNVDGQIAGLQKNMNGLQKDVKQIRSEMVTKDFLDKKLNKSHGRLVGAIKRADQRTIGTIDKLRQKKIFAQDESQALLAVQLFER